MLTLLQAIILGLAQGITELFPISSLGHTVLLPGLFGWNINQNAETFLEFLVATHLATATVLFVIYFKDWVRIIKGIFRSLARREISDADPDAKARLAAHREHDPRRNNRPALKRSNHRLVPLAGECRVFFDAERSAAPARRVAT